MLKTLLLIALLLNAADALGQSASGNLSVTVTPPGSGACPGGVSGFVPSGYSCNTAMTDEFNGSSLDTSKWRNGLSGGQAGGAGVNGYHFCSSANVVGGGNLQIRAFVSAPDSCTGGVVSANLIPPAPVYVEWRAKMGGTAAGIDWPIWMLGDCVAGNFAEIDIVDNETGNNNTNLGQFLWNSCSYSQLNNSHTNHVSSFDTGAAFHVYGLWKAGDGTLKEYVDGTLVNQVNELGSVFDSQGQRINMEGGREEGCCINSAGLPQEMDIDYVRVYCPGCH
jgi:hypothetical protein